MGDIGHHRHRRHERSRRCALVVVVVVFIVLLLLLEFFFFFRFFSFFSFFFLTLLSSELAKNLSAATIVCVGGAGTTNARVCIFFNTTTSCCLPGALLDVRVFAQLVTQQHVLVL